MITLEPVEAGICPGCGYNLRAERPIQDGPWRYSIGFGMSYAGARLNTSDTIHEVMGTVMSFRGRTATHEVIADRLGATYNDPRPIIRTYMHHARKAVAKVGADFPIVPVWGDGLRWRAAGAGVVIARA